MDAKGRLGGLIFGWRKQSFTYSNCWSFSSCLGTLLYSQYLGKELSFLNIYGPYTDKVEYWDKIFHWGWLHQGLTIPKHMWPVYLQC